MYGAPDGCLLLVRRDEDVLGCVALRRFEKDVVRATARGLNIGRRLATEIIQRARAAGYRRMVLDTLRLMEPAQSLYRSLGFREIAPYYRNPLDGVVYMELDLR